MPGVGGALKKQEEQIVMKVVTEDSKQLEIPITFERMGHSRGSYLENPHGEVKSGGKTYGLVFSKRGEQLHVNLNVTRENENKPTANAQLFLDMNRNGTFDSKGSVTSGFGELSTLQIIKDWTKQVNAIFESSVDMRGWWNSISEHHFGEKLDKPGKEEFRGRRHIEGEGRTPVEWLNFP